MGQRSPFREIAAVKQHKSNQGSDLVTYIPSERLTDLSLWRTSFEAAIRKRDAVVLTDSCFVHDSNSAMSLVRRMPSKSEFVQIMSTAPQVSPTSGELLQAVPKKGLSRALRAKLLALDPRTKEEKTLEWLKCFQMLFAYRTSQAITTKTAPAYT